MLSCIDLVLYFVFQSKETKCAEVHQEETGKEVEVVIIVNFIQFNFYPLKMMCTVCRGSASEDGTFLLCGHVFHDECIRVWISKKHTCPNCRTSDL